MERKELSAILLELLEKETGEKHPALDEATDLRHGLNLDSLDLVCLVLAVESRLKIQVPTEELNQVTNVGALLDVLQQKIANRSERQAA